MRKQARPRRGEEKLLSPLLTVCLILAFLLALPSSTSAGTWYVSSAGSDTNNGLNELTPFQTLDAVCAAASGSTQVIIAGQVILDTGCAVSGTWTMSCNGPCGLRITPGRSIDMAGASMTLINVELLGESSGVAAFRLNSDSSLLLGDLNATMTRPLVTLDSTSEFTATTVNFELETPLAYDIDGWVIANGGKVQLLNSKIQNSAITKGSVFLLSQATLLLEGVIVQSNEFDNPVLPNPARFLSAYQSLVSFEFSCKFNDNLLFNMRIDDHPTLMSFTNSSLWISNTEFISNSISCPINFPCSLASLISLSNNSSYWIEQSKFTQTSSPGCGNLHAVDSSGTIVANEFSSSSMTGEPGNGPGSGDIYPPMSKPKLQATVCLTRPLASLQSDFGRQLSLNAKGGPSGVGYRHNVSSNTWTGSNFQTTSSNLALSAGATAMPPTALYPTDLWASNVELHLSENTWTGFDQASVRVDACDVRISTSGGPRVYLPSWIDFGSQVFFANPVNLFEVRNLAIYGAAPGATSKYWFEGSGRILLKTVASLSYHARISGGEFVNANFRQETTIGPQPKLTLGRLFPETLGYSTSTGSMPWADNFRFQGRSSGLYFGPQTDVLFLSITSPLVLVEPNSNLTFAGRFQALRYSSPYAAGGPRPATIRAPLVFSDAGSRLDVTDLCVEGNMYLAGDLVVDPSLARGIFHGLNVTGQLSGISIEKPLVPFNENRLFGLGYPVPKVDQAIPFLVAHSVSNFRLSTSPFYIPTANFKVSDLQTAPDSTYRASYVVARAITGTIYMQANGAAFVVSFRWPGLRDMAHGISPNCAGFFEAPTPSGLNCHWIGASQMIIWSNEVMLPASVTSSWPTAARWSMTMSSEFWTPGKQGMEPTALLRYVPSELPADSTFWLDATPSYHLGWAVGEVAVTWDILSPISADLSSDLVLLLAEHRNDWRWEVPAHLMAPDVIHSFRVSLTVPWSQATPVTTVEVVSKAPVPVLSECDAPLISLDVPSPWHLYDDAPGEFRIIVDPKCVYDEQVRYQILISLSDTYNYTLTTTWPVVRMGIWSATGLSSLLLSSTLPLSSYIKVVAIFPSGQNSTAGVTLVLHAAPPSFWPARPHDIPIDLPASEHIMGAYMTPAATGGTSISHGILLCPEPDHEHYGPYSDPLPSAFLGSTLCWNGPAPYAIEDLIPDGTTLTLPGSPRISSWARGQYSFPITLHTVQQESTYVRPMSWHTRLVDSSDLPPMGPVGFGSRRGDLLSARPSESFQLTAIYDPTSPACTACMYSWQSTGMAAPVTGKDPYFAIPFQNLAFAEEIPVSVTVTAPDGKQTKAIWDFKTQYRPFGGSFNVTDKGNGYFDAEAKHWSSDSPSLSYAITQTECDGSGRHRLLSWTTYSPSWKSIKMSSPGCSAAATVNLLVWDGMGSMSMSSATLPGYELETPNWTQESLLQLATNITRSFRSSHLPNLIDYLYQLPSTIQVPSSTWSAVRADFSSELFKGAYSGFFGSPFGFLVLDTAFGHPDLWYRLDAGGTRNLLLSMSAPEHPVQSLLSSIQWPSWHHLVSSIFESYVGPNLEPDLRSANQALFQLPSSYGLRNTWGRMLTASVGPPTGTFATKSRLFHTSFNIFDANTVEGPVILRPAGAGPKPLEVSIDLTSIQTITSAPTIRSALNIISDRTHYLMPASPIAAPHPTLGSLFVTPNLLRPLRFTATFQTTPDLLANNPQLVCAISTNAAWYTQACTTSKAVNGLSVSCQCSYSNSVRSVDIALLNPSAFCPQPIPGEDFICVDGAWILEGDVDTPVIILPPTGVTIIGNLTVDTIQFGGLAGTVNVTGCTKVGTSITIELTLEELEALISSGEITSLLLTSTGCDISDLKNIPISVTVNGGDRCEKVTVTSETTTTTLSGVFKVDTSGCKKKSSTWWIVLVSVLGGVIVLGAIFALLATFTPLKHIIRPHAKRAEEANTYYINDAT